MAEDVGDDGVREVERLFQALGEKYAVRILAAADRPKSAQEISDEVDVPIATCYRRIDDLEDANLLHCVGGKTSGRGRRTQVYRRTIDGVDLELDGETPSLAVDARTEPPDPLRDRRDE